MTGHSGATRIRKRLVSRRPWQIVTYLLWLGPIIIGAAGIGLLVPAALHRAIERKRFPGMRVGDGLIP